MINKEKEKNKIEYKKIWKTIWPAIRSQWKFFPILIGGGILLAALTTVLPYIYGSIIDLIIGFVNDGVGVEEGFNILTPLLLVWIGVVILNTGMNAVHSYTTWWVGNHAGGTYLKELYRRMLRFDMKFFEGERAGNLLRRFDNAWESIFNIVRIAVREVFIGIVFLVFAVSIGFYLDWRMMLISFIPIPFIFIVGLINFQAASSSQDRVSKSYEKLSGFVGDSFSNIATVKSFLREERNESVLSKIYKKTNKLQNKINLSWAAVEAGYGAVYTGGRLLIFVSGVYFVIQGSLSVGTLMMFLGFTSYIFSSVQRVVSSLPAVLEAITRLGRAEELWHRVPTIGSKDNAKKIKRAKGDVVFEKVSFSYNENRKVLRSVSFEVQAGKTLALVGESGAGKSTLAKMMLRFQDPTSGSIKIDGYDLRDLTVRSVRANVGFVMQENLLFHDSIINNIKLAKSGSSEKEIIAAAKKAQAHEFISKLPEGYKSMVGERGVKLSGGQKQRIALARVFLENPPILVLDEATSALDSKTEHNLQEALLEVMKDRTTIVIAHRLSTVMAADQILVMDKGKIIDQGTHEELIKRGGLYEEYWKIQAGGYL